MVPRPLLCPMMLREKSTGIVKVGLGKYEVLAITAKTKGRWEYVTLNGSQQCVYRFNQNYAFDVSEYITIFIYTGDYITIN